MKRQRLFWILLISTPVLFFAGLEAILRLAGYGGDSRLVLRTTIGGKEYFSLNRDAARVYFSQRGISVPELHDDRFVVDKPPTTKRVFMLGESTMAGFPFDYNATPSDLLRDRLQQLLPQYTIEVVNVGVSAVNSYTLSEFLDELVNYQPDAIVLYLGHNEFYGAFGVGSSEYLGQSRFIIRAYLSLNSLKFFQLLRNIVTSFRAWIQGEGAPREGTLMEAMVRNKSILYRSPEYEAAKRNFEANLLSMIAMARERRVPLVLSTLASNIRDQAPLRSSFSSSTSDDEQKSWEREIQLASEFAGKGDHRRAAEHYRRAVTIDSCNAEAHFRLGACLESLQDFTGARTEYEKARDHDALRFRASSDFNSLLRSISDREHVGLADAERSFAEASPHGVAGRNLMLEHLHPNFDGYLLLAKTFVNALARMEDFLPQSAYRWDRDLSDSAYKVLSAVTPFDLASADERILELTHSWPFTAESYPISRRQPDDRIGQTAWRYVRKQIAWSEAHYALAEWYKARARYDSALTEYRAVAKVIPYSYVPFMHMGDVYRLMNRPEPAAAMYERALSVQNSPFVHVRQGMLLFEQDKLTDAIREFEAAVRSEPGAGETFDTKELAMARFFLGAAYGRSGNLPMAKSNLQMAVRLDPTHREAKKMLEQIP